MADRGGKIVPGQVCIEVEYDYEYEAKDRKVVIKQGERYILVKKTNDDWWQVKLDENSKAFYVPAQYVREVGRRALMPPVKQAAGLPNHSVKTTQSLHLHRSTENVNKLPELSSFGKPSPPVQGTGLIRDANQNFGPSYIPGQTANLSLDLTHNHGKFNSDSHSPKVSGQNRTRLFGPFPGPEFLDVEKAGFSQEQSCDSAGEGSERIRQDSESGDELSSSSTEQTRWLKHVDDQGRQYYYSADGSRSEWELPKESPTASKPCYPENESSPSSPKNQDTGQEKYGLLNVTKITENGKKVRKNWLSSWAVLQGSSLLFTKTQGSSTSWFGSNQSKPEFTVDLKGATIEMASKDKSSKKNVFELKTRQGTELLIQSDNDAVINEWFKVLSSTVSNQTVEPDEAIEEDIPDSPGIEKHDKEKDHKDLKKLRSTKVSSIDSSEQKKTKKNLKKFLTRRPTLQAVREKGYIKDQVFGANLANLCQRENGTVPKFVKLCIEHVEQYGLDVDGIYRVSGNLAVIQKLRFTVNHDEKLDLKDSKWEDIHVITGALKMFFRELPEPLFTFNHFNDFVNAIKQEPRQRVSAVKDLIKQLPKPNQDTMQTLFRHLKRVIENGEKNRMTYQSIAIVFGPTLLKPEKETGNIAVHTVYQNQIVELILLEINSIFGR
ncbi:rho GTPase-activating protein 12 isoform X8 [Balaenoptera acutorostrata]|uniref:Rho GTPase-activating protein 12 isoform X8 n=1 Tax=Balaenoptera acutorostrata TaxID=9767 RepID=A0ABM3TAC8_BALAC|nr:rho GTPase-activating protein 12 isoform X8 [Balaenoptera acutorostrata]